MTTWLRYVGASIMGILDPIPAALPSPMSDEEGAWVRANAWTTALRRIDTAYPHGFHRWCSCERGTCHPCRSGHHDQCISANGPRVDEDAGTMTDRDGFVVAVIRYRSGERRCRWNCPCIHTAPAGDGNEGQAAATEDCEAQPAGRRAAAGTAAAPDPDGQLSLFASSSPAVDPAHGETP
ncbi:DUF6248 family natural product biosynthesis protein [Streptomyces sp. RK76]|uniref:DUF6248 family natural product biosynthesis protein n=1 Tax=Streptomyces sp. RK76 TaxID=2824896 RepID=UPI001B378FDD|nr:DUF6248 family natural product biosynthesis protein [Streptomyces sp. RK76]MBQ0953847.1 hypothetical protein [Streptomyces sp. RK76]